jgi:vacuolar-type H+-ATPase subunit C/Vma6
MIKFSDNPDYGFAIGRVRAKETSLLKRTDYDRIVSLTNPLEIFNQIKGIWQIDISEPENFDTLLEAGNQDNINFFNRYCLDLQLKKLLTMPINNYIDIEKSLKILGNDLLNEYFTVAIDLENIRNLVRIKNLADREKQDVSAQKKKFNGVYLKNGSVSKNTMTELFNEDWNDIIQWSAKTRYQNCIEPGLNFLINQQSFIRFEKLIEEEKQKILIKSRFATFGFEPLVAYYLFKENEIKNIRKIYFGISQNAPIAQIKESIACVL